jgi:hypothetical protein
MLDFRGYKNTFQVLQNVRIYCISEAIKMAASGAERTKNKIVLYLYDYCIGLYVDCSISGKMLNT